MKLAVWMTFAGVAFAQSAAVVVPDLATAKWEKDDNVLLREDPKTGAMDLLVRYPAGKKLNAHWHSVTERLVLVEGKIAVNIGGVEKTITPGGVVIVPPKEGHQLACVSDTRCTFYIAWDGKLDTHRVQ